MEASEITARSEKVSSIVLSEIYHFQHERVVDFREMMKFMLQQQINFYTEVCTLHFSIRGTFNDFILDWNIVVTTSFFVLLFCRGS